MVLFRQRIADRWLALQDFGGSVEDVRRDDIWDTGPLGCANGSMAAVSLSKTHWKPHQKSPA
jgi:hypothetical protein